MKMCQKCGVAPRKAGRSAKYCDECTKNGFPSQSRIGNQAYNHGVDVSVIEELERQQGGRCAICGHVNTDGRRLAVDHDHSCCPGKHSCGQCIRGLLCDRCNRGLGFFDDDPARLRSAAEYLGVKY